METLNYDVLKRSGYQGYILEHAPEKILQFGEGNFLRAFVDYWFDMSNEKVGWNGKCVLVQPIAPGLSKMINAQQGLYTLYLRGRQNGEKVDIDLFIIVEYGISISAVAASIIETVKYKVEHLTGISVGRVNVCVEDIRV